VLYKELADIPTNDISEPDIDTKQQLINNVKQDSLTKSVIIEKPLNNLIIKKKYNGLNIIKKSQKIL
jgi:hypothetical protein